LPLGAFHAVEILQRQKAPDTFPVTMPHRPARSFRRAMSTLCDDIPPNACL